MNLGMVLSAYLCSWWTDGCRGGLVLCLGVGLALLDHLSGLERELDHHVFGGAKRREFARALAEEFADDRVHVDRGVGFGVDALGVGADLHEVLDLAVLGDELGQLLTRGLVRIVGDIVGDAGDRIKHIDREIGRASCWERVSSPL